MIALVRPTDPDFWNQKKSIIFPFAVQENTNHNFVNCWIKDLLSFHNFSFWNV